MTPIQEQTIPAILDNQDIIACAQTGTGKTAAFLVPIIERLCRNPSDHSRALIVVPTRELALQIDQNIDALSYYTGVSSVPIIGGKNLDQWDQQKYGIENGADVLIATPGRLLMHMALEYLKLDQIEVVVLDEADKMMDMGFYGDIVKIINETPENRQTLMFSATMPANIRKLAKKILKDPTEVNLKISKPAAGIKQQAFSAYDDQKIPLLEHLLKTREVDSMIIFASSKSSVDKIHQKLKKLNYPVEAIHSDKSQDERSATLRAFKNKQFKVLVGTDVLSRGIDIDNLSHVLNYDVPMDAEDYVHRVGRTARASSTGEAITFINPKDQRKFAAIEQLIEMEVPKLEVPAELGDAPSYRPGRGRGGRNGDSGRGGGRSGRGGGDRRNRSGGGRRRGGGSGKNHRGGNRRKQEGGDPNRPPAQQGQDSSKSNKKRKRRRPKRKPNSPNNPNKSNDG